MLRVGPQGGVRTTRPLQPAAQLAPDLGRVHTDLWEAEASHCLCTRELAQSRCNLHRVTQATEAHRLRGRGSTVSMHCP